MPACRLIAGTLVFACLALRPVAVLAASSQEIATEHCSRIEPGLTPEFMALVRDLSGSEGDRYCSLGLMALVQGFPEGACWAFGKAVLLEPDNGRYLCNFGFALLQLSEDEDAIAVLRDACHKGGGGSAYNNLARAYTYTGDSEKAKQAAETACRESSDDPFVWMTLIEVERQANPAAAFSTGTSAARDGLLAALGGPEVVHDVALEAVDAIYDQLVADMERAEEIYTALAARAEQGLADETYWQNHVDGFTHYARMWADSVAQVEAQRANVHEQLANTLTQVRQSPPPLTWYFWNILCDTATNWVITAVHGYQTPHTLTADGGLGVLMWTDTMGGAPVASDSWHMEDSPFSPLEDWWWARHEKFERDFAAAPTAEMMEAVRLAYLRDVRDRLVAFWPVWQDWCSDVETRYEEGCARWFADKLYWYGVAVNAQRQFGMRLIESESYRSFTGGMALWEPLRDVLLDVMSVDPAGSINTFGYGFQELGRQLREHMEWSYAKHKYRGGGFIPEGDMSSIEDELGRLDDTRDFTGLEAAIVLLAYAGRGEWPPVDVSWNVAPGGNPLSGNDPIRATVGADGTVSLRGNLANILGLAKVSFASFVEARADARYNVRTGRWSATVGGGVSFGSILDGVFNEPAQQVVMAQFVKPWVADTLSVGWRGWASFDPEGMKSAGVAWNVPMETLLDGPTTADPTPMHEITPLYVRDVPKPMGLTDMGTITMPGMP